MPRSTMTHEDQYKLPKETLLPAALKSVTEETIPYVDKNGKDQVFTKWTWEFEIIDGEYMGLHAWGESEPRLTNHPDNKVRQWGETLTGTEFDIGDGIDTDDLLGLTCCVVVDNVEHKKKNGDISYLCPVIDVLSYDSYADAKPPF